MCEVSQNLGYQLYATLGAFYIPLLVMIVMYYKIYMAAKRVVDAELRDQRPVCSSSVTLKIHRSIKMNSKQQNKPASKKSSPKLWNEDKNSFQMVQTNISTEESEMLKSKRAKNKRHKSRRKDNSSSGRQFCCYCCCSANSSGSNSTGTGAADNDSNIDKEIMPQPAIALPTTSATTPATTTAILVNATSNGLTMTSTVVSTSSQMFGTSGKTNHLHKHLNGHQKLQTSSIIINDALAVSKSNPFGSCQNIKSKKKRRKNDGDRQCKSVTMSALSHCSSPHFTTLTSKQRASNALRERKASVTLGMWVTLTDTHTHTCIDY